MITSWGDPPFTTRTAGRVVCPRCWLLVSHDENYESLSHQRRDFDFNEVECVDEETNERSDDDQDE